MDDHHYPSTSWLTQRPPWEFDPAPPTPYAKHKTVMTIEGKQCMVWNLNFGMQVSKPKAFDTASVAVVIYEGSTKHWTLFTKTSISL